jgi:hypothetical protein
MRQCVAVAEKIGVAILDATNGEDGRLAAQLTMDLLQELWDSAYEAGRRDR